MYSIDRSANRITPLRRRTFRELGFAERAHLQEWLAQSPEALEPLLIIAKEFSGWDKTSERLDLLALDASGRVVVIELKLDDSGKDVTWQALKYAAYCSQLKTSQIVEMYRSHRRLAEMGQAREEIAEFLGRESAEDLALNPANSQRVILVAAHFRPEVTATALWLLGRGLDVSCFQATAFEQDGRIFLSIDQVIPVPEAGDFMITIAEKAQEDEGQSRAEAERHRRSLAYWTRLLEVFDAKGVPYFRNRTPGRDNWITTPIGIKGSGVMQLLVITQGDVRAQINFERASSEDCAAGFAALLAHRDQIEAAFGAPLEWIKKEGVKTRRLVATLQIDTTDPENIDAAIEWQADAIVRLTEAVKPFLIDVERAMNAQPR